MGSTVPLDLDAMAGTSVLRSRDGGGALHLAPSEDAVHRLARRVASAYLGH